MCVVLGIQKGGNAVKERTHYVLLITPTALTAATGEQVCERVGVGFMPGRCIELDKPGSSVKIR